jgi:hypothetical protein
VYDACGAETNTGCSTELVQRLILRSPITILTFFFSGLSRGGDPSCEQVELRLIQSKSDIENPPNISTVHF